MGNTLKRILYSYKTTIVLLAVYAAGLAVATFIEKYRGLEAAKMLVYLNPVFFLLQFLLVVNFTAALVKRKLLKKKKWGFLLVHFSFILILLGALVSHLSGVEGVLHLREGEKSDRFTVQTNRGESQHKLPFEVELVKFTLKRYPGSMSPSSYESEVLVHDGGTTQRHHIYMNNVLDRKGYRFFQASFDKDERGTILSVNKDVAGMSITYAGYLLLTIGLVLCLVGRNSRFRHLARQLKELRKASALAAVAVLLAVAPGAHAQGAQPDMQAVLQQMAVDKEHAARFGALPMQSYNGRMMPVNTFSSEVLRKLHKSDRIGALSSDQFLISLLAIPDMWMRLPFLPVSNKELTFYYDLPDKECSYLDAFDTNGQYKFQEMLDKAYQKMPSARNRFDKDLMKLDEQVNILHQLFNHQLLNLFPREGDPNHKWYAAGDDLSAFAGDDSVFVHYALDWYLDEVQHALKGGDWTKANAALDAISAFQQKRNTTLDVDPEKIAAEVKYNESNMFNLCKKLYLILGGILLVYAFLLMFRDERWLKWLKWPLAAGVLIVFHLHMLGMGARWYIGGYAPWSNSYETMVYVAWATVFGGLLFYRRSLITFALATLFAGIILFVSSLNWMDPQINPLVPVLKSPWLMFHVAVIVAAYGFFGISFLIGLTNLAVLSFAKKGKEGARTPLALVKELTLINEMSLLIGLALMTVGTFLGAVWANESWGRYWGWDPKETWALITVVVYAIVIHLRLVRRWDNPWLFNVMSVAAFASVLMTYFGVNYFLSGMHSYGQNDQISGLFGYLCLLTGLIAALAFVSYRKGVGRRN